MGLGQITALRGTKALFLLQNTLYALWNFWHRLSCISPQPWHLLHPAHPSSMKNSKNWKWIFKWLNLNDMFTCVRINDDDDDDDDEWWKHSWDELSIAAADYFKLIIQDNIVAWMSQDVKYNYTVKLAGTGDRSEYDTESHWKVVVVFQEWYGHRGSPVPASVNIIDLTWLE